MKQNFIKFSRQSGKTTLRYNQYLEYIWKNHKQIKLDYPNFNTFLKKFGLGIESNHEKNHK